MKRSPFLLCALPLIAGTLLAQKPRVFPHLGNDRYANWSPDGKHIVFESDREGHWDLFLLEVETGDICTLSNSLQDKRYPSWHPDGKRILHLSNDSGNESLQLLDIENGDREVVPVEPFSGRWIFPKLSPRGGTFAITGAEMSDSGDEVFRLYLVDLVEGQRTCLTPDDTRSVYPTWSADASKLAFFSRRDTRGITDELYTLDLSSGQARRITHWPAHNFAPAFSPDGKWLACATSKPDARPEICIVSVATGEIKWITDNDTGDVEPSWSPDGKSLVWSQYQNGHYELVVMNIERFLRES